MSGDFWLGMAYGAIVVVMFVLVFGKANEGDW